MQREYDTLVDRVKTLARANALETTEHATREVEFKQAISDLRHHIRQQERLEANSLAANWILAGDIDTAKKQVAESKSDACIMEGKLREAHVRMNACVGIQPCDTVHRFCGMYMMNC